MDADMTFWIEIAAIGRAIDAAGGNMPTRLQVTTEVAKTKNRIIMFSGPATNRLTNENCTPISIHYAYDTYALAAGTGGRSCARRR